MADSSNVQFVVEFLVEDRSDIRRGVISLRLNSSRQRRSVSPVFLLRPDLAESLAGRLLEVADQARKAENS